MKIFFLVITSGYSLQIAPEVIWLPIQTADYGPEGDLKKTLFLNCSSWKRYLRRKHAGSEYYPDVLHWEEQQIRSAVLNYDRVEAG